MVPHELTAPRRLAKRVFATATLIACLPSLLGFLGGWWWRFDLLSHFRPQYAIVLSILALVAFIARMRRVALAVAVFMAANLALILPLYLPVSRPTTHNLRVGSVNLLSSNHRHAETLEHIRLEDPDVLLLMEFNSRWEQALKPLRETHPYRTAQITDDNFGIALLSKVPFESVYLRHGEPPHFFPHVVAQIRADGRLVTVIGAHPPPPRTRAATQVRDEMLREIGTLAATCGTPVVVMGDFNATSWSAGFRAVARPASLKDTRQGFGLQMSWPSYGLVRVTIDHCLVSREIGVRDRRVGPFIGSDHRPVFVDLEVP